MARLPDAFSLGDRPSPRPSGGAGGYRVGQAGEVAIDAAQGTVRAGEQLTRLGQYIGEREDRLSYARARSAFLRAKIKLDGAFDEDQDYLTWEKRYGAALTQARDEIAKGIGSNQYRAEFEAETGLDFERGLGVIREKVQGRVRDAGRADLLTTLLENREAALASPDAATREQLILATNDAINSAVGTGLLSAVEGVEQREAWAKTYQADREARFAQTFTADLDRWRNAVLSDPGKIGTAEAELAAQIAASGLPEADKLKYAADLRNGLAVSALTASILSNPAAAKSQLMGGKWDGYLDADKKATLLGAADVAIRQREAEYRQRLAEENRKYLAGYEDTVAFLRDGGVVPDNPYSRSALVARFGEEEGGALAAEVEGAVAFGQAVSAVKWATPEEIQALVAAEGADLTGGAGYKTQRAELTAITAAVAERNKALLDDPAAFVAQAPNVKAAYEAMTLALADETGMMDGQAAVAAFANASLAEQERLGLEPEQQRLLPQAYVDTIVSRFTFQPEGGENAAAIVQSLAQQWGRYWPKVAGELSGDLPGVAAVIASMPQGPAAERLAEAANVGAKTIVDTLDSDQVKTLRDSIPAALAEFRGTLTNQPGGEATYAKYAQSTELLALKYLSEGRSPSEAAQLAAMDTVAARYAFVDTYRIPIEQDPAAIERGAAYVLSTFGGDPGMAVDLPTSLMGLNEGQTRQAYLSALRRDGYWVTAPDESGLVLYDATGSAVTIGGRPVTRTWADLANPPRQAPVTPIPAFQE